MLSLAKLWIATLVLSFTAFSAISARPINAGRSSSPSTLLGHRIYTPPSLHPREAYRYSLPRNGDQDQTDHPLSATVPHGRYPRFSGHMHTHPLRDALSRGSLSFSDIVKSTPGEDKN